MLTYTIESRLEYEHGRPARRRYHFKIHGASIKNGWSLKSWATRRGAESAAVRNGYTARNP
jgi:hypothetical protein